MHSLPKDWGKVAFSTNKGNRQLMLLVSEKLSDKGFFRRLNSISSAADAIASDVMYHNLCWADAKKKATPKSEQSANYSRTLADIEITDFVESYLNDSSERVLDMNKIDEIYKGILMENRRNL